MIGKENNGNISRIHQNIVNPILDKLPSEPCHDIARSLLHLAEFSSLTLSVLALFADQHKRFIDERLKVDLAGISFENPLMVGAGWDKDGKAVSSLYTLGFSSVEVGSVTMLPQAGNPKPRQFAIGAGVAINHIGLKSSGVEQVAQNLKKYKESRVPIGISLGKNKGVSFEQVLVDYATLVEKLYPYAAYFAINVSCPNTPGLKELQDKNFLLDIVSKVKEAMDQLSMPRKPIFIKISPELSKEQIDDVIEVITANNLAGIIATNTTTKTDIKRKYGKKWENQQGGLSGNDQEFRQMANDKIKYIFQQTGGAIDIIGVGGVNNLEAVLEKIKLGAKMVQVVTAMREVGVSLPGIINRGLIEFMDKEGISSLDEIRGLNCKF